jgi:hypothetical protein
VFTSRALFSANRDELEGGPNELIVDVPQRPYVLAAA